MNVPHEFIVGAYNDLERSLRLIEAHRDQLAAILVEPMLGSFRPCARVQKRTDTRQPSPHAGCVCL